MPLITGSKTKPAYDVIVVGSGAAGGISAYLLALNGVKVLMLEAGRHYDPATETPMFNTPEQAPLRGASTPDKPFGFYDSTVDGGWQVPGEPYRTASGPEFKWWRPRMLGGRTNHWGRISLRMGEYDFKPHTRDGLGFDWPVGYDDIAPYYDRVELLIGVHGTNEGLENTPDSPNNTLLPAPKPRGYELLTQKHCRDLGIPVIPSRLAILTARQDPKTLIQRLHPDNPNAKWLEKNVQSRLACWWSTSCGRGCSIKANFQSTTVLLPPAIWTGNLDIVTDAMVREVELDEKGRAKGVIFIDKETRKVHRATARAVILGAGSCETVRILMNSKSKHHPDGIGNENGLLGKYIMDTVGGRVSGQIPAMESMPPAFEEGTSGMHMYMPWWGYQDQAKGKLDFPRGYHIEFHGGRQMPSAGILGGLGGLTQGAYGVQLKEAARRYYGSFMNFSGRGEMVANKDCFCEIDPEQKDQYGIPTLRFHWKWSDHELKQVVHMHQTFRDIIESMGGKVTSKLELKDGSKSIYQPGEIIHEVGGARMGDDPSTSVTNAFSQVWSVPNLIVADGASFVSSPDKNCTITIMALAWRAMDHLMEEMKKGHV